MYILVYIQVTVWSTKPQTYSSLLNLRSAFSCIGVTLNFCCGYVKIKSKNLIYTSNKTLQIYTSVSQNLPSILFWTAFTAATLAAVAARLAAVTALFTCSSTRRRWIAFSAVFLAACKINIALRSTCQYPSFQWSSNISLLQILMQMKCQFEKSYPLISNAKHSSIFKQT